MACDPDDQNVLVGGLFNVVAPIDTLEMPLPRPDCLACGIGFRPGSLLEKVSLQMPLGFKAAIIDSEGNWVAKSEDFGTSQLLTFKPDAFYGQGTFGGLAGASFTDGEGGDLPADDVGYRLLILPGPDMVAGQTYSLAISIEAELPGVYLPLVLR